MDTGLPKRTALTTERRNSFSDSLMIWSPASLCVFLIHLLAWPCGSIIKDHRDDLERMMAFSVDRASVGKPAMFHARIATGSASVLRSPAPGVDAMQ
jgi:hypothetical protein